MSKALNDVRASQRAVMVTPRRFVYSAAVALLCALLLSGAAMQYANYVDRKSNQRWCGVVEILNDAYEKQPPTTDAGRALAVEMAKLQKEFDC